MQRFSAAARHASCACADGLSPVHGAAVLASYEKHFPLKELAPDFTKVEAARKEAGKARGVAKKAKRAVEKAGDKAGDTLEAGMEEEIPQPGGHRSLPASLLHAHCSM